MNARLDLVSSGMLTVAQAADLLSLGRTSVYKLMETGDLCYVKLGRARRIPKQAVLELAARNLRGGWLGSEATEK